MAEWDPPRRMKITGDSPTVAATDIIELADAPNGGTELAYTADIRLKGLLSLFTFLVAGDIAALGKVAEAGLVKAFAEGKHTK